MRDEGFLLYDNLLSSNRLYKELLMIFLLKPEDESNEKMYRD